LIGFGSSWMPSNISAIAVKSSKFLTWTVSLRLNLLKVGEAGPPKAILSTGAFCV
jgi:hypothetical protein